MIKYYVDKLHMPFIRADIRDLCKTYVYSSKTIIPFSKALLELTQQLYGSDLEKVLAEWHFDLLKLASQDSFSRVINVLTSKRFEFDQAEFLTTYVETFFFHYFPYVGGIFTKLKTKTLFVCLFANIKNMPDPKHLKKMILNGKPGLFSIGASKIFNIYIWEDHFDWTDIFKDD